jgi:poly-gamma-glutamate capsule biosynthesis protein CapA/YwtB (metallophosphatase superfamily)
MSKSVKVAIVIIMIAAGLGAAVLVVNTYDFPRSYTFEKPQPNEPPKPVETTVFLAGDVMLSRNVGSKIVTAKDPELPFKKVGEDIKNYDISFANLESPFNNTGSRVTQGLVFKAEPDWIKGLLYAGFDVMSTANNHAYDQGKKGIEFTLKHLSDNGIVPVGTGLDCHDGVVITKNNLRIGFLAYSYAAFNDGGNIPDPLVCDWNDTAQIKEDVAALKLRSDFVIVSGQYGIEYQRQPEPKNVVTARAAVDAGADLVIGHHPHWVQIPEQYKGKWILYGIGNFVFDQMWSQDTREGMGVGLIFENKTLKTIELKPVIIDDYCCPRWANNDESLSILKKINLTSPVIMGKN